MSTVADEEQHPDGHDVPYTHGHHDSLLRSHRWRTAQNSAGYLLPHLAPGTSLLDVGCGPGTITRDLAALLAPGRVVGLDASVEVIEEARLAAAEQGIAGLTFEVGDFSTSTTRTGPLTSCMPTRSSNTSGTRWRH